MCKSEHHQPVRAGLEVVPAGLVKEYTRLEAGLSFVCNLPALERSEAKVNEEVKD